jgi:hypothetical protein
MYDKLELVILSETLEINKYSGLDPDIVCFVEIFTNINVK